jgi:hypothetical protein
MKKLSLFIVILAFIGMNQAIGQWTTDGNNIYNTNSGYVGIGNNSPSTLLYVAKNMTEPTITVRNLGGPGGATFRMWDNASGADWKFKATNLGGFKIRDNAYSLDVFTIESNSAANLLYLKSGGRIGIGTAAPASSALVDISSTNKGFLPPRMTYAQLIAIPSPADGLLVYCTDCGANGSGAMTMYIAGSWNALSITNCIKQPLVPSEGTHVPSETQIIWNWNAVSGASGYKWNTANDYATAEDMSTGTSKTETGLSGNTSYTRYVWSYNTCGNSTAIALTSTTTSGSWVCGNSIIINHVVGNIAPVTKTVTYGTVTGIPGASSKCWITSNLGADHQATAVNDDTEASAGWYWQFNRQQGFKHDGTTRTPNTTCGLHRLVKTATGRRLTIHAPLKLAVAGVFQPKQNGLM